MISTFLGQQGLSPFSGHIQLFLAEEDLIVQAHQVQLRTGDKEAFLRLFGNILPCRHLCARCPCLSLIHISEPTRLGMISYAVFCLKKKKKKKKKKNKKK